MKKTLVTLATLITLFAVVPNALALTKAFQVNTASGGTLTTGLVSYYNMQGNSNDYYGSNNGTDTSVTYSTSYGKVAQGGDYNGSTAYSSIGNVLGFDYNQAWSISAWIYNTALAGESIITKQINSGSYLGYGIETKAGGVLDAFVYGGGGGIIGSFPSAYSNAWHHIVVTYSGNNSVSGFTFYVDGSSVSVTTIANVANTGTITSTAPFQLSGRQGANNLWGGYLDEVGIWSRVLTSTEVTDLYNGGAGQTMCNGTGGPLCSTPRHHIIIVSLNWKPEPIA